MGEGNITIHDRKRQRYRCKTCKQTFSARRGTMFEGLRKPMELIVIVVTLLSYGCPVQAIVHAFGLDERTVASWRDRAGAHCEQIHHALIETGKLDLVHVQADEIRVKGRKMIAWMGLAMMVSTRLWLAGTVSVTRDKGLADALMQQVRRSAQRLRPLLVLTDGWAAYPGSIRRAFREKVKKLAGVGRASLEVWPQPSRMQALHTGMYLVGCTYNFCCVHQELSKASHFGKACTPAMASGLTDHVWSICELLQYKVAPSPWIEPKRRGRPKKQEEQTVMLTKRQSFQPRVRPLVRLRKGVLCSITS